MPRERDDLRDLTALADELLTQAGEIRRQWADLAAAVGADGPGVPLAEEPAAEAGDDEPIRLVALDMALSGAGEHEVTAHLEKTFPGVNVDRIVDAVFREVWRQ